MIASRLALCDLLAEIDDDQPVDDRKQRVHDMLDPDDRHAAAVNVLDGLHQRGAFRFGQAACDLVEQQQLGLGAKGARQLEPFALKKGQATGERIRLSRRPVWSSTARQWVSAFSPDSPAACVAAIIAFSNTVMPEKGCGI